MNKTPTDIEDLKKSKKYIRIIPVVVVVLIVGILCVSSYIIRQNQYQEMLAVSVMENNKDIIETDALLSAEYDTMSDNPIKEFSDVGQDDDLGQYGEPASKLSQEYEDAMENSNLEPYEIDLIRSMVEKENKTFEQALQAVRPGSKVIQEQPDTQTANNNQKPQPTTPTQPSRNTSNSATVNNPDNRSDQQKKADEDAGNAFGGGVGGKSQDVSHEPDFGLPDNRTEQQKQSDANDPFNPGTGTGPGGDTSHEPDF